MPGNRPRRRVSPALPTLVALGLAPAALAAPAEVTSVELNRLEPVRDACRVYLVVTNGSVAYAGFGLDLVLFGRDGVIARRLSAEIGPLRAGKRQVRLFDVQGLDCGSVGGVLVNDVLGCRPAGGDAGGDGGACLDHLEVGSRVAGVDLSR